MSGIGNFIQGAAGGALGGSTFGPAGGLVGGILGGLGGMFGSDPAAAAERERQRYLRSIRDRQAPELGPASTANYSGFRDNQGRLISQLEAMGRGEGPSVARQQFREATDRNIAAQNAMAAGGRGNAALNAMNAMNNTAALGAQAAQGAALGRVQEQTNALNNLGMQLYSARGADEDINRFNASQRNQMSQAQGSLRNQFYGIQDSANLGAMGMANRGPSMADQILAGGGQMRAWYDANQANSRGAGR